MGLLRAPGRTRFAFLSTNNEEISDAISGSDSPSFFLFSIRFFRFGN
jgi:hypothetical protein